MKTQKAVASSQLTCVTGCSQRASMPEPRPSGACQHAPATLRHQRCAGRCFGVRGWVRQMSLEDEGPSLALGRGCGSRFPSRTRAKTALLTATREMGEGRKRHAPRRAIPGRGRTACDARPFSKKPPFSVHHVGGDHPSQALRGARRFRTGRLRAMPRPVRGDRDNSRFPPPHRSWRPAHSFSRACRRCGLPLVRLLRIHHAPVLSRLAEGFARLGKGRGEFFRPAACPTGQGRTAPPDRGAGAPGGGRASGPAMPVA